MRLALDAVSDPDGKDIQILQAGVLKILAHGVKAQVSYQLSDAAFFLLKQAVKRAN